MSTSAPEIPETTRRWVVKDKPGVDVAVTADNFELQENVPIFTSSKEGKILVKVEYISTDAGQRTWMHSGTKFSHRHYIPGIMGPNQPVFSGATGVVVASYTPDFLPGEKVFGHFGWTEYALHDPKAGYPVQKIPPNLSPQEFLVLELTSQAAYFGFMLVGKPSEKTKTVVVSAAAGGTGILVAQIAKRCLGIERVVGVCGSDEKCKKLLERGYLDVALNYKSENFEKEFEEATPGFVDIYFDNVGGKLLDTNLRRIAPFGKVVLCGAVSSYESGEKIEFDPTAYMQLIHQGASIEGILVIHWYHKLPQMLADMACWHNEGKIDYVYDEIDTGFKGIPGGFRRLLDGGNFGKNILKVV